MVISKDERIVSPVGLVNQAALDAVAEKVAQMGMGRIIGFFHSRRDTPLSLTVKEKSLIHQTSALKEKERNIPLFLLLSMSSSSEPYLLNFDYKMFLAL